MGLKRGVVPGHDSSLTQIRQRMLNPQQPLTLPDEEVPRSGVIVTRSWQYARWVDGSTHVWIGHRKEPGRGEGSSGLRLTLLPQSSRSSLLDRSIRLRAKRENSMRTISAGK